MVVTVEGPPSSREKSKPPAGPTVAVVEVASSDEAKAKACDNCGEAITGVGKFCANCGTPIAK